MLTAGTLPEKLRNAVVMRRGEKIVLQRDLLWIISQLSQHPVPWRY